MLCVYPIRLAHIGLVGIEIIFHFQYRRISGYDITMNISNDQFDLCVTEAINSIDSQFRPYLDEVPVIVEDMPDEALSQKMRLPSRKTLLGLFRGVPLNRRSVLAGAGPNQIVLYRHNLLAQCRSRRQLAEQIRRTLVHELAHYLGFSESQISRLRY